MLQMLGLACAMALVSASAVAAPHPHLPARPSTASLLAAAPIAPNGTLIREGERLRTLELDELAPLRLRFTVHF
ncbi:hypothetical protein [Methylobacterium sp. J-070]|uniref:hypothetical protein n=1 Tax=Methylobacterium sp. J-070 TaxID=2836650 RepID=UPI001FBA75E2|nr:hypothetical protein [Methylobacterium sp. J-070]MCJ2053973.1 hypothetical protein [Methylobacterium sp. J-070]